MFELLVSEGENRYFIEELQFFAPLNVGIVVREK